MGAVLEFTFWVEGGAFTQVGLRRPEWGRGLGRKVDREFFASELRESLPRYVEGVAGLMRLTLRREERGWRADFKLDTEAEFPLEAKTWPVQRMGLRAEVLERLSATGREVASRMWAPAGAQVRWQVEVELEDERVTGLETRPPRSLPGGKSVRAAPESAMHEQIQREWREQTQEGFKQMAVFTAEQVALFVVGGLAARGLGVVMEATAPMIARMVTKGGTYAVGWFRSLFARVAPAEKQLFARLMAKVEAQGLEALTVVERNEVQAFLGRLEHLASARLNPGAKDELRKLAREDFAKHHPDLVKKLSETSTRWTTLLR